MVADRRIPGPRLVLSIASIFGMLAMTAYWFELSKPVLAWQLQREIDRVPPNYVQPHLQQLSKLGVDGLPGLVTALASERTDVSRAAVNVLEKSLREWRELDNAESTRRVYRLAQLLADNSANSEPLGRRDAARLAQRILLWPIDRGAVDGTELVGLCDVVIRAGAGVPPPPESPLIAVSDPTLLPAPERPQLPQLVVAPQLANPGISNEIPGIAVPPPMAALPRRVPHPVRAPLMNDESAAETVVDSERDPLGTGAVRVEPIRIVPEFHVSVVAPQLKHLADIEVMRALHEPAEVTVRAAERELMDRGFRPLDIRVAKQLVDPSPERRTQLVNSLPSIMGLDPRPWLMWLARDRDPIVRKAAHAILETSSDPSLLERLRQLEREERNRQPLEAQARRVETQR